MILSRAFFTERDYSGPQRLMKKKVHRITHEKIVVSTYQLYQIVRKPTKTYQKPTKNQPKTYQNLPKTYQNLSKTYQNLQIQWCMSLATRGILLKINFKQQSTFENDAKMIGFC